MAPYSASGVNSGGLSPPPSVLSSHSSAYSQLPISTSAYSSSSSPSHTSNVSQHLPTPQAPTHHASYRDHSDSYRNHHHSTISSQVRHTIRNITLLLKLSIVNYNHILMLFSLCSSRPYWGMPQDLLLRQQVLTRISSHQPPLLVLVLTQNRLFQRCQFSDTTKI